MLRTVTTLLALAFGVSAASAREIHVDCARAGQSAKVDADSDRLYLQIMWNEGVAEEYKDQDFYISGPDADGLKEKVVYGVKVEKELISFTQERQCLSDGAKRKCSHRRFSSALDLSAMELRYDDGETIAVLKCDPAPPGRGF